MSGLKDAKDQFKKSNVVAGFTSTFSSKRKNKFDDDGNLIKGRETLYKDKEGKTRYGSQMTADERANAEFMGTKNVNKASLKFDDWANKLDNFAKQNEEDKTRLKNEKDQASTTKKKKIKNNVDNLENKIDKIDQDIDQLKHDNEAIDNNPNLSKAQKFGKKFGNTAGKMGKAAADAYKKTDSARKLANLGKKLANVGSFIAANWLPISIIIAIIATAVPTAEYLFSKVEQWGGTPHYYCEMEPDKSLKNTALYKQYCGKGGSGIELTELNGHYVTQDGSGPCTSCATINMLIRYYATKGINLYDYMWQGDGQYTQEGQTLQYTKSSGSGATTIRKIIRTSDDDDVNSNNAQGEAGGTIEFAAKNGKPGWTMSNWGYVLDDETYETKEGDGHSGNANWVWDLSIDNGAPGSSWYSEGSFTITVDNVTCKVVKDYEENHQTSTLERIKDLLKGADGCIPEAGVYISISHPGGGHGLLITGYDEATDEWKVIDSALYQAGGFEGVADDSGTYLGISKGKPNGGVYGILKGNPAPGFSLQTDSIRYIKEQ